MSDPDLPEAHYNLGLALAQLGRLDQAARALGEAVSLDPQYTDALVQLGLVYLQSGDSAAGQKEFSEAIRIKLCPGPLQSRVGTLQQQGKEVESRTEFERAFAMAPELRNAARP